MNASDMGQYGLETEACRRLLRYWLELRGAGPVPCRAAIDPGALKPALPHIFMLNMIGADTTIYRLVGTAHRARWGIELTGHVWGEFLEPEQRIERTRRLWRAVDHPCGFVALYDVIFASRARDPVETLLLPLRPDREAGCPIMIGASQSLQQADWVNQSGHVSIRTPERFRFLDLGWGLPAA